MQKLKMLDDKKILAYTSCIFLFIAFIISLFRGEFLHTILTSIIELILPIIFIIIYIIDETRKNKLGNVFLAYSIVVLAIFLLSWRSISEDFDSKFLVGNIIIIVRMLSQIAFFLSAGFELKNKLKKPIIPFVLIIIVFMLNKFTYDLFYTTDIFNLFESIGHFLFLLMLLLMFYDLFKETKQLKILNNQNTIIENTSKNSYFMDNPNGAGSKIMDMKKLQDLGILTEAEFEQKKNELLKEM